MQNPLLPCFSSTNFQLERFILKLKAQIFALLISIEQLARSFYLASQNNESHPIPHWPLYVIVFTVCGLILTVFAEYLLYRKAKSYVLKWTKIFDISLCFFIILEWLGSLFVTIDYTGTHNLLTMFNIASFSGRVLLQSVMLHNPQGRIVLPLSIYGLLVIILMCKQPEVTFLIAFEGILGFLVVGFAFYIEHCMANKLYNVINTQVVQTQFKDFLLDSTSDKIALFDLNGESKYMNNKFDLFLDECDCLNNMDLFLKSIKTLQRCDDNYSVATSPIMHGRSLFEGSSYISLSLKKRETDKTVLEKTDSLKDFIEEYREMIAKQVVEERKYLVLNGKLSKNGLQKAIEIKVSHINQHANQQYIVLIINNIEDKELISTLRNNSKYKDQLLASVSHELRTPLNGNINLVEAAIRANGTCETVKETLLTPALKSSKFLLYLINDILDLSQIQAQKLRLVFQSSNLKETFLNSLQLVELQAKKKGISLETNFDPSLPELFCTDHVRLSQIILNLVNNSIKFTEQGFVKLSAIPVKGSSVIKISVEDTGIGMKKQDIAKLFNDYTHIEHKDRANLNPAGVGLGLNIAYNLAQLLGPKDNTGITVFSIPKKGSIFSFEIQNKHTGLKLQINEGHDNSSEIPDEMDFDTQKSPGLRMTSFFSNKLVKNLSELNVASPKVSCDCPRILIVDDDPFNILAFETILGSLNAKYDCAYNGRSAIDKMLNRVRYSCSENCKSYQLVFLDQEMPGMTGTETAQEIVSLQRQKLLSATKIVGCSAHETPEQVEKFKRAGVTTCITKPCSKEMVKEIVDRYLL